MTDIALERPPGGSWHRLANAARRLVLGLADGLGTARRYRRLAAMSDAQLARRGLTRNDVPWFAVFGERRPR